MPFCKLLLLHWSCWAMISLFSGGFACLCLFHSGMNHLHHCLYLVGAWKCHLLDQSATLGKKTRCAFCFYYLAKCKEIIKIKKKTRTRTNSFSCSLINKSFSMNVYKFCVKLHIMWFCKAFFSQQVLLIDAWIAQSRQNVRIQHAKYTWTVWKW